MVVIPEGLHGDLVVSVMLGGRVSEDLRTRQVHYLRDIV